MTVPTEDLQPAYWHADLDDRGLSMYARRLAAHLRRRVSNDDREVFTNFRAWKTHLHMGHASLMQAVGELENEGLIEIREDRTVIEVSEELVEKCFFARAVDELDLDVATLSIYLRLIRRVGRPRPGSYGSCYERLANIGQGAGLTVGTGIDATAQGLRRSATNRRLRELERVGLIWSGGPRPGRTTAYHCRTNRQWSQWKEEMQTARRLEELGLLSLQVEEPTSPQHFAVRTKADRAASESTEQALEPATSASIGALRASPDGDGVSPENNRGSPEEDGGCPEEDRGSPEGDAKVNPLKINPSELNSREVSLGEGTTASPPAAAGLASPDGSGRPTTPGGSPVAPARFANTPDPTPNPSFESDSPEDSVRCMSRNSERITAYSLNDARELEEPQERFWAIYEVRVRDEFGVPVRSLRESKRKVARMFEERGDDFMLTALEWFFDNWALLKDIDSGLYKLDPFPPVRAFYSDYHLDQNRAYIYRDRPFPGLRRGRAGKGKKGRSTQRRQGPRDRAHEAMVASELDERRRMRPILPSLDADLEHPQGPSTRSAIEAYNAHRGDALPEATSLPLNKERLLRALLDKHGEEGTLQIIRDRTREAAEHPNSFVRLYGLGFLVERLDSDLPSAA